MNIEEALGIAKTSFRLLHLLFFRRPPGYCCTRRGCQTKSISATLVPERRYCPLKGRYWAFRNCYSSTRSLSRLLSHVSNFMNPYEPLSDKCSSRTSYHTRAKTFSPMTIAEITALTTAPPDATRVSWDTTFPPSHSLTHPSQWRLKPSDQSKATSTGA